MLTTPTYLTGVNDELLGLIRDESSRRAHPWLHARFGAVCKAASVAEQAVEGVIRYFEQEAAVHFVLPLSALSMALIPVELLHRMSRTLGL